MQELTQLNNHLYKHFHSEVYRQCWGDSSPDADPGLDYQKLGQHLSATRATTKWLSAVPTSSKAVSKEIRKFQKTEKKLAKSFMKAQEQHHFIEAKQALVAGLAAFAISAPFSNNLQEVREQAAVYRQDLNNLQNQPPSPAVKQVQGELNQRYQALYQHWASLEEKALETELKSKDIHPPFSDDFTQARTDYDLIMSRYRDVEEEKRCSGSARAVSTISCKAASALRPPAKTGNHCKFRESSTQ